MAYTFDSALRDPDLTVIDRNDAMGSYIVQIGTLPTYVSIELGRFMTTQSTKFILSHTIKTPEQSGPYRPSKPWGDYPEHALHRAVDVLTSYYRAAVNKGHTPSPSWLVKT